MKKVSNLLWLSLVFCQLSCQGQQNSDEIIIPLDVSSQRPIVEVTIGKDGPYQFIFDTGASGNVIDEGLAEELKLNVVGEDPMGTPGGPSTMMSKRVEATDISFPGSRLRLQTELNTIPLRQMVSADGIISPAAFSDYLVTVDYQAEKLTLTKGSLNENDKSVVSFSQESRVINTQVDVDGNVLEAHLDSGNPGFFALPYRLKDKLSFKEEPVEDGMIRTPGAEFKKWKAQLDGDITIGNVVFKDPVVQLAEGFPVVNMGFGFFSQVVTTIDRKNGLIQFNPSMANGAKKMENKEEGHEGDENEYTGWYGGKVRKILFEDGQLYVQRTGGPKLKLEPIEKDYYKMTFSIPTANELPNVRFERKPDGSIRGLTYVFSDGREDFVEKDE